MECLRQTPLTLKCPQWDSRVALGESTSRPRHFISFLYVLSVVNRCIFFFIFFCLLLKILFLRMRASKGKNRTLIGPLCCPSVCLSRPVSSGYMKLKFIPNTYVYLYNIPTGLCESDSHLAGFFISLFTNSISYLSK